MSSIGIVWSYNGFIPSFLRNHHTVFHSGCINLHSNWQDGSLCSTPSPAFIVCRIFDDGHSDWCEMVSRCSFDLHFFNNEQCWASSCVLLVICMSSLEKCLFRSFYHFLIELFAFLALSCMSCLYILETNPLSVVSFAIIFSHSEGGLLTLLIVSFAVQNLLSLIRSYLFTFVISISLGGGSQRTLLWFMSRSMLPLF